MNKIISSQGRTQMIHGMKMCSKMNIQSNIKILKVGANKSSESAAFLFNKKAF
jgi:hypothetical protein